VIAGPDEDGSGRRGKTFVEGAGIAQGVEFVGPAWGARKWELMKNADLFVIPSLSESFGLVVAEALACAVPVVATRAVPWAALEREVCGWWAEDGKHALRDALAMATSVPDATRRAMGERGRRYVERELCWETIARRFVELYRWLLGYGWRPEFVVQGEGHGGRCGA
jgi:glycosyltransferase involved in cell wall biosynthesis